MNAWELSLIEAICFEITDWISSNRSYENKVEKGFKILINLRGFSYQWNNQDTCCKSNGTGIEGLNYFAIKGRSKNILIQFFFIILPNLEDW